MTGWAGEEQIRAALIITAATILSVVIYLPGIGAVKYFQTSKDAGTLFPW